MPSKPPSHPDRDALRRRVRAARRALSPAERQEASLQAAGVLITHPWFRRARRIALYYPVGSETDTTALFAAALQDRKQVYLPAILRRHGPLCFVRFRPGMNLRRRRHGIPQPRPRTRADRIPANCLDLVVVPLLGFDKRGHRLGSGAGYYDRSFEFRRLRPEARPRLVGLAFACQRVDNFTSNHWDVPLDAIATEAGWLSFRS